MNTHKEDRWIYTQCHRCQSECGLRVHMVDGVAVKIEGVPESSIGSRGGVCPRGLAGLQVLYDPNRLNYPLKRTNPEKGLGVDPKWERISWDEAMDTIIAKMKDAYEESPNSIVVQHGIVAGNQIIPNFFVPMLAMLANEKGAPIHINAAGSHCGNAGHFINSLQHGAFVVHPDYENCNYLLVFGTNSGNGGFQQWHNKKLADARARGMKMIVFDPMCNAAAANADEWIPIVPGTDGAVILAMLNVIVNELEQYDIEYCRTRTNAPYLVDSATGKYVRCKDCGKPLMWDEADGRAKAYDDPTIVHAAIAGEFTVNGVACVPSWVLMKERFAEYTPEYAAEISQVPADTIRRIAKEYADEAQLGATKVVDGYELPYRPVATLNIRSAGTHTNGLHCLWALDLLSHIMGAVNTPGGLLTVAVECNGYEGTGKPYLACKAGVDGFTQTAGKWLFPQGGFWPVRDPEFPKHDLEEMFPTAMEMLWLNAPDRDEVLEKFGLRTHFKFLINYASNAAMNGPSPKIRETFYRDSVDFIVDCDIYSNEFNEGFADILLPDACYLERDDWMGIQHPYHNIPVGMEDPWSFHTSHRVVDPMYERRDMQHLVIDIAERMGLTPVLNGYWNHELGLTGDMALKPDEKIVWEDLCNRACIAHFGPEHDWAWFTEHGFISWPKTVQEVYWRQFKKDVKTQMYWEFMVNCREKTEEIARQAGVHDYFDWTAYDPLPKWFPTDFHKADKEEYPLYGFSFSESFHSNSNNQQIPWINELSQQNPFTYFVNINEDTAAAMGLKAGDLVEIETSRGHKTTGCIQTRQSIHPECLGIMGVSGHWAKGMPIAKGKGSNFNTLIDFTIRGMDPLTATVDVCVKCRLTKLN